MTTHDQLDRLRSETLRRLMQYVVLGLDGSVTPIAALAHQAEIFRRYCRQREQLTQELDTEIPAPRLTLAPEEET